MKLRKRTRLRKEQKKRPSKTKKRLDSIPRPPANLTKKKRGRRRTVPWEWVTGRASNYEFQLNDVWEKLEIPLVHAKTAEEVTLAFEKFAQPYAQDFVPLFAADIVALLNDGDFPQRASPRIGFLARSLAGRPSLSFRTSRDICEIVARKEKQKSPHRILRREFYIECSCGYRGPALDNKCRKCGAEPPLSIDLWTGQAPSIPSREEKKRVSLIKEGETDQIVVVVRTPEPNHVQCHCGATIAASTRDEALKALAEHQRLVHGEVADSGKPK